jgi:ferredoxin
VNRRKLIGALAAAIGLGVLPRRKATAAARLRPPGALDRGAFEQACIGCYRCAEVCPTTAIRFPSPARLDAALPYVEPRDAACVLCMQCTLVCPTGALLPLVAELPAMQKSVKMGWPKLTRPRCLPWTGAGVCRLCFEVCPYQGSAVELVGEQLGPLFHAEACVGCGLCEEACPDGAHAITIVPPGEPG